jgi:hypothetical protein
MGRPLRWWQSFLGGVVGSLLLVAAALYLVLQHPVPRRWLLEQLLQRFNAGISGTLSIGDLQVRLTRLELFGVVLRDHSGDTVAAAERIAIAYEPFALTQRRIILPTARAEGVRLTLVRGRDSLWNFERIFPRDTQRGEPPELSIWLRSFHLQDAELTVVDSLSPAGEGIAGQQRWQLRRLNLLASAAIFPHERRVNLAVRSFSATELLSGALVEHLSGSIALSPRELRLEEFRFRTPGAGVRFDIRATSPQPTTPDSLLQQGQLQLFVRIDSLVPQRLRPWLPSVPPLTADLSGILEGSGTLEDLRLQHLWLHSREGWLRGSFRLRNGRQPERAQLSGTIATAMVPVKWLRSVAAEFPPELAALGFVRLQDLRISASRDSIAFEGGLRTGIGALQLQAWLHDPMGELPAYRVRLRTTGIALHELLPPTAQQLQPLLLRGSWQLEGRGRELSRLQLRLQGTATGGQIGSLPIAQLDASLQLSEGFLTVDSLWLKSVLDEDSAEVRAYGWADLRTPEQPSYRFNAELVHFPLAAVLQDTALPQWLSARFQLSGRGAHPDSLEGFLQAQLSELQYAQWALLPFELAVSISRPSASVRFVQVTGAPATVQLSGQWRPSQLPTLLEAMSAASQHWLWTQEQHVRATAPPPVQLRPLPDTASVAFRLEIRDLGWLNRWLAPNELTGSLSLEGTLSARPDSLRLEFSRLLLRDLHLRTPESQVRIGALRGDGLRLGFSARPTVQLRTLGGSLLLEALSNGKQRLDSLHLAYTLSPDSGWLRLSAQLLQLRMLWEARLVDEGTAYRLSTPLLALEYAAAGLRWMAPRPFELYISPEGITVDSLLLQRPEAERLCVHGRTGWERFAGLELSVQGLRLRDLLPVVLADYPEVQNLDGLIDSARVRLQGAFAAPEALGSLWLRQLRYEKVPLGTLRMHFATQANTLQGELFLEQQQQRLLLSIGSFPLVPEEFERVPVALSLRAERIAATVLSPAAPQLRELRGQLSAELTIQGHLPTGLEFEGWLRSDTLSFVLQRTAIPYRALVRARFLRQQLTIEQLALWNLPEDLPNSGATLTGTIGLRQLRPWAFDLRVRIRRLLVLSYASAAVNPMFYGPVLISTGSESLQLWGTWEQPQLSGTLLLLSARLILPEPFLAEAQQQWLLAQYHWVAARQFPELPPPAPPASEADFATRLRYDLRVYLVGEFFLTVDLAPTQQLIAILEAETPGVPLAYVTGPDGKPQLLGRFRLREGSTYKFYRNFAATGVIAFTTGELDNPELDLEVRYQGVRILGGQRQSYEIRFTIQGSRRNLRIGNWRYWIAGTPGTGDESKLFSDIVWLLLTGRTQEELEGGGATQAALGSNIPIANLTTIASKAATELFRGLGVVQDVQLDPVSGTFDLEQLRARITGQLGGITLRWGGTVGNPLQQAEFSVEIPLSELLRGSPGFLRQVLLQLSTTTGSSTVTLPSNQRLWEVRISVRL